MQNPAAQQGDAEDAGPIGVFTDGLWRLRADVATVTGQTPSRRRFDLRGLSATVGWGHKPTALAARLAARIAGLPYVAIEDGFLRSVRPGDDEPTLSYVCDREGIYYDARGPSALERLVRARTADPARAARDAAPALYALRGLGLSKYNLFEDAAADLAALDAAPRGAVLVVDQTAGDAAVRGARADRSTFRRMLVAAAEENPDSLVVLKTHPETRIGRRAGCCDDALLAEAAARSPAFAEARSAGRLRRLTAAVAPVEALARVRRVYVVSSLMGLEALVAGVPVACFGQGFYAGWGLTDDRAPPTGRRGPASLDCLLAAAFMDYCTYLTPHDRRPCRLEEVADHLAGQVAARRAAALAAPRRRS